MSRGKKQTAADIVMSRLLWCGGEQKTMKQIFDELLAQGHERKYVDFYLFSLAQHQPTEERREEEIA